MPGLNYAKWDNIDVSDDEDDTHPNVDTPSLFRWRHKARIEREGALRKERFEVDREGDRLRRKEKKLKRIQGAAARMPHSNTFMPSVTSLK